MSLTRLTALVLTAVDYLAGVYLAGVYLAGVYLAGVYLAGGNMFNFVHHVRILVHDADQMVEYMDRNFGMTPVKVQVYESRGMKNAIYKVGSTNLEFTEPLDANSKMAKFLAEEGPGVYHIAFGVDDVRDAAKELLGKGNKLRGEDGITQSAEGYFTANIDPESALGFPFQLAEG